MQAGGVREVRAVAIAALLALAGWYAADHAVVPLMFLYHPGWELAGVLRATYWPPPTSRHGLVISHPPVFLMNVLVWTGVILVGGTLLNAIGNSWWRSRSRWSLLSAAALTFVSEMASYDNYSLPLLPLFARPGWTLAPKLVPITSFVLDFRSPLGLFWYPDRLVTTLVAVLLNLCFWTVCFFCVSLAVSPARRPLREAA